MKVGEILHAEQSFYVWFLYGIQELRTTGATLLHTVFPTAVTIGACTQTVNQYLNPTKASSFEQHRPVRSLRPPQHAP